MKSNFIFKSLIMAVSLFSGLQLNAQDWPNLGRFSKENAALAAPAKGENRVVFMGNSITQGWIEKRADFFSNNPYINRGISGQTTPQMLIRFRQDVIALQPKVVVILAGTNDIAGNTGPSTLEMIEDNLASMAELANANGIRVVLSSVLPVLDYPWKKGLEPAEKIVTLNAWMKAYCEKKGFIYLDYFTPMATEQHGMKSELTTDGVHASVAGYKVMEPLVVEAITKALKSKPRK
ncbi:MAG: SGNH/GDSL hydrolase family protein [Paludibacter sp.]|nr:SGNH/GDSL hydrolase family protein [Paludibacter sp.]